MSINRREFLAACAAAGVRPASPAGIEVRIRKSPAELLLRHIEPGSDAFPREKEAFEIAARLKRLIEMRSLPLAPEFRGVSPFPRRYVPVADGVSAAEFDEADARFEAGLRKWLDALGEIREVRFFVLAGSTVRYEVASAREYRAGTWKQEWKDGRLVRFAPVEEIVTTSAAPLFEDITAHAFAGTDSFERQLRRGVPYWRARLDAASGMDLHGSNGIAVGDIDGDGWDEIYVCQPGGLPNRLYRNRGDATLEDMTERAGVGVLDATSSALFADFRNSGAQDLVVLRPDGPLLYLNDGTGRFTHKPGAFRFRTAPQGSFTGMAAADYDRDGRLDLYLCTYQFFRNENEYRYPVPYHDAQNGPANFLFRNLPAPDGGVTFDDVTESSGMSHNNNRYSFAPAWCDYDGDGWPDLYVANDFGRNNLYRNKNGQFRDVAAEAGVQDIGAGMSAAWFDYDGDGRPDLYVANMWSDAGQRILDQKALEPREAWRRHAKGNSLYRNRGDGTFEETGAAQGVEMGRWAWSADGVDFDNDGAPEILITSGMVTNASETDLESFFWRQVAAASPPTAKPEPAYEHGWNALTHASHQEYSFAGRQANLMYVRRGGRYYDFSGVSGVDFAEDSRAFAVTDIDGDGNVDLLLKSRLGPQVRVLRNNCGAARRAIAFRLSGVKSNRDAIGARVEVDGQVKFLTAGSGYLSQHSKALHFGLGNADSATRVRVTWPSGATQELRGLAAGRRYDIEEGSDRINGAPFGVRKPVAAGIVRGDNEAKFEDAWLLEPVMLPEKLRGPGFLHLAEPVAPERAALYALFCRHLFDDRSAMKLPMWFLVDEQGRAHKIYFSPPDPSDLERMRAPDRERLALPFPGKYYAAPRRNYGPLGAALFQAGYREQALPYLEMSSQHDPNVLFAIGQIHLDAARGREARTYFERGLAIRPDAPEGWNNLGGVAMLERNYRQALAHYQKAIELRPAMIHAIFNAGQAHVALGDADAAERMFRRVLEISPDDADAANQMGELLAARNRDHDARPWFLKAIAARRDYGDAIDNLGKLYVRIGQTSDAIAAFRYGNEVAPDAAAIYLNLSSLLLSLGRAGEAREALARLLVRQPGNVEARRALRDLENR